jgi:hypothetical protein
MDAHGRMHKTYDVVPSQACSLTGGNKSASEVPKWHGVFLAHSIRPNSKRPFMMQHDSPATDDKPPGYVREREHLTLPAKRILKSYRSEKEVSSPSLLPAFTARKLFGAQPISVPAHVRPHTISAHHRTAHHQRLHTCTLVQRRAVNAPCTPYTQGFVPHTQGVHMAYLRAAVEQASPTELRRPICNGIETLY